MSGGSVLIAEDSMVIRALLRKQLEAVHYTVVEATDGVDALAATRRELPDVVLLDVEMPALDGFAVLEAIRADPALADTPVVFITGRADAADAVRGLELGAHDYLRKPFEPDELVARVRAAMRTKHLQEELKSLNAALERQAGTDGLTGLPNRRMLDEALRSEIARGERHGRCLAVLVLDVDRFKAVNDTHGHAAGDAVLREAARRLTERLRRGDVLGRWDGDEFLAIAPETDAGGAEALAQALRAGVARGPVVLEDGIELATTVSVGWACRRDDDADALLRRADAALHAAKEAGRDRVRGG